MLKNLIVIAALLVPCLFILSVHADEKATVEVGEINSNGVLHVSAVGALKLLEQNTDIIVLDVRTGIEFGRGHVDGAININYYSFSFKKQIAALDPSKTYLVHCATGVRSGNSMPIMLEAGFENLIHMDGGFRSWKNSGLPIKK